MTPAIQSIRQGGVFGTIVVSSQGKFLLVRGRATGKWSFPKGHAEGSEAPLDCAKRELFEETGVSLKDTQPTTKLFCLKAASYFLFRISSELKLYPQDRREIMDFGWFTIDEMQHLSGNIDVSVFIQKMKKNMCY